MDKILKVLIGAGVLMTIAGLLVLPSALYGQTRDQELLATALAFFGMGALIVALSLYLQTRGLQARLNAEPNRTGLLNASKRKGTCDNCKSAAPIIQCTIHRVNLCATCLLEHYDPRGCVYIPAVRKSARPSRRVAAGRA